MRICIALLLKDAERYLQSYLFQKLDELEAHYRNKHTFTYVIYERNSSDYTAEFVKMFAKLPHRVGRVHFHTQPAAADTTTMNDGTHISRIQRICNARNEMLDMFGYVFSASDWTLFINSDIYFEADYIQQMLHHASHAAIITCNSIQLHPNTDRNAAEMPYATQKHYYDTYACLDIDYNLHYPLCISPECIQTCCKDSIVPKWNHQQNVVEVQSAWGGFVLVNSRAFTHDTVCWETTTLDKLPLFNGQELQNVFIGSDEEKSTNAICEHIMFCNKVKNALERPVVIMTELTPYWISAHSVSK